MNIILGLIIGSLITYIVLDKRKIENPNIKLSKEDQKKIKESKKSFDNLMKYDYRTALGSDKNDN